MVCDDDGSVISQIFVIDTVSKSALALFDLHILGLEKSCFLSDKVNFACAFY